jgi:hypothetical protein
MLDLLRDRLAYMSEDLYGRLLKPGAKALLIIAGLSLAAQWLSEKSLDRGRLAQLATSGAKATKPR